MKINKNILLATLVVLLAIHAANGQLLINLIGAFSGIVSSIFSFTFQFVGLMISFTTNAVAVAVNSVFVVLSNVHYPIYRLFVNINQTLSAVENITSAFNSSVFNSSQSVSPGSFLIGRLAAGTYKDAVLAAGFSLSALLSVLSGRRYAQPTFKSLDDDDYFDPSTICIPFTNSNASSTNATIACQANVFVYLAQIHVRNLKTIGKWYETIGQLISANCSAPNTASIQNLTDLWSNLSATVSGYVNITVVNGTLLAYANATISPNLTAAIQGTQDLFDQLNNATACIINATHSNNRRIIDNIGLAASFANLHFWHGNAFRRNARRAAFNGLISFVTNANSVVAACNSTAQNVNSLANAYSNLANYKLSLFSSAINSFYSGLNAFFARIVNHNAQVNFNLSAIINCTENNKSAIITNVKALINATIMNLTNTIAAENITQCINFLDIIANAHSNFTINIASCGDTADKIQQSAQSATADAFANITSSFNATLNALTQCYSTHCSSNLQCPFSSFGFDCIRDQRFYINWLFGYSATTVATNWGSCVANAAAAANTFANLVANITAATISNLQNSIANATNALANCTDAAVQNFRANVIAQITAEYNTCKQNASSNSTAAGADASASANVGAITAATEAITDYDYYDYYHITKKL